MPKKDSYLIGGNTAGDRKDGPASKLAPGLGKMGKGTNYLIGPTRNKSISSNKGTRL